MKFFTKYDRPPNPIVMFDDPSFTDQSQKDDCDINKIMDRYKETGYLVDPLHPPTRQPIFGDFSDTLDYQGYLDAIKQADEAFLALPSAVRDRFGNDPQKVIDFLNDEKNFDEAVELGLCNPRPQVDDKVDDKDSTKDV